MHRFSFFAKLVGVEPTEDPTLLGEEDGAQESCMVVLISYVDSQSIIHGIDIDLNAAPETDVVGDDVYHSRDPSNHEVDSDSDSDLDLDEVLDDIDDKYPDAAHAAKFPKYPEILPTHWIAVYSDLKELFVGQRFKSKENCAFSIKEYSMNISLDNKVTVSKPTLHIGEC
ncbi:hypothetical protein GOBAR_AA23740 [Gossypium barbadense]|uniref:Transposase MuDR plant domain-containing protein n=1 Tax=Gossypium barbadense TaxID=3634 RepID=A0A2P5X0S4_GOSBA|nr:hypothetical protein GOBAR_AA23740 [Gossypium barbadense]